MEIMTDVKSGPELVEKAFAYMSNLSRESRKALTAKFGQAYKGMPFSSIEPTMRKEIETWFSERDKNITIKHESSTTGKPGEIMITYSGANKDAHFKFRVDGQFTVTGSTPDAPTYLKNINIAVDKRDFTK
jgi:lysine/ornithine N-monooxygenase